MGGAVADAAEVSNVCQKNHVPGNTLNDPGDFAGRIYIVLPGRKGCTFRFHSFLPRSRMARPRPTIFIEADQAVFVKSLAVSLQTPCT